MSSTSRGLQLSNSLDFWPKSPKSARVKDNAGLIKIPGKFSFITDPEEALSRLNELVTYVRDKRVRRVVFDHRDCQNLDLCASAIMDVLFLRGRRSPGFRRFTVSASGFFSANDDVNVLLKSNGILKNLNHPSSRALPPGLKKRLRIFHLRRGYRTPPEKTSDAEQASTDVVEFFNSCLRMEGFRLKKGKQATLVDLIAEVLVNAEEHSDPSMSRSLPAWYVIGYHKGANVPGEGGECHIVLFNFGESIYQSLASPETSDRLKDEISSVADVHRRHGFFDQVFQIARGLLLIPVKSWQEDALWTLYALQEGVSRFRHRDGGEDRGNGTVRMIDFFTKLASSDPKMVILSGRTWILFDGTHSLRTIMKDGGERKIIAFNPDNDLNQPPNPMYVRTLEQHFPGTLVSLKFTLRSGDLAKMSEGLDEDENG